MATNRLTPTQRARIMDWILALESGKFKQTTGNLCKVPEDGGRRAYCCLGVAAEKYAAEVGGFFDEEDDRTVPSFVADYAPRGFVFLGNEQHEFPVSDNSTLPSPVEDWFGLSEDIQDWLAQLNDMEKFTFKQIARVLRYCLVVGFEHAIESFNDDPGPRSHIWVKNLPV